MLKLTKKADYALMAMKHLADHAQAGTGSASAKDVADSFGIPPEALAKILQRLVRAGLLLSHHGTPWWLQAGAGRAHDFGLRSNTGHRRPTVYHVLCHGSWRMWPE